MIAFSLIAYQQGGRTNVGSLANKSSLAPGAPSDHHVVGPDRQPAPVIPEVGSESVEVHLGKGYEALKQDHDDAAENFRAALKVDPTLVMRARCPLATALFRLRSFPEARHELETVRREVGERPSICYYFGRLDPEEQNYKSAVANLNKAIAKPPFPDTTYFLGFAYLKEGSDQNAEKWLKEAAKRNPEDSRAEYQLALSHKKEGREEEAKQAFSRTKEQRDQATN